MTSPSRPRPPGLGDTARHPPGFQDDPEPAAGPRADAPEAEAALAGRLEAAFSRRRQDFALAAHRVRSGSDAEAIHDLRVAARRLIAVFRVWERLFRARDRRLATRLLRNLRRRLGEARELEVHVAKLEAWNHAQDAVTQAAVTVVLRHLGERLARRRRRAARRVRSKRLRRILRLVDNAASDLARKHVAHPDALIRARHMEAELEEAARAGIRSAAEEGDEAAMHEARLAVKKWRYAIECVDDIAAEGASPRLKALREVQEVLGTSQDRATLIDLLGRYWSDEAGPLRPLIDELEAERAKALEQFRRLVAAFPPRGVSRVLQAPSPAPAPALEGGSAWRVEEKERMARWLAESRRGPR